MPTTNAAARQALIKSEAAGVRLAVDSLLASTVASDTTTMSWLEQVGRDYLDATGDSLLLRDLALVPKLDAPMRATWLEGVRSEETGLRLRDAKEYQSSAGRFETAARLYAQARDLRRQAIVLGSLGVAWFSAGDFEAAGAAYQRALEARRRLGDPILVGRTLNGLGSVAMRKSDYTTALSWYEEARLVREKAGDRTGVGTTLSYIGNVQYLQGNLEAARSSYLEALEVLGLEARPADLHPARLGLANVHWSLGEYREAQALYVQEKALLQREGDTQNLAVTQRNLALYQLMLGDYAASLQELREAREAQEASGERFELARTQNSIGSVYLELGDYPQALEAFKHAAEAASASHNEEALGEGLEGQARTFLDMGYLDRALETYARARDLHASRGDSLALGSVLSGIAAVEHDQGRFQEALVHYREVLGLDTRFAAAPNLVADRLDIANQLASLGHLVDARREYETAVRQAGDLDRKDLLWKCDLGIADTFERAAQLDSARAYNARAIAILEGLRSQDLSEGKKATLLGKSAFVYEAQVHVLGKLQERSTGGHYAEEAFAIAEQGKSRALLDLLTEGQVDLGAALPPDLARERDDVERALNAVQYLVRRRVAENAPADSLAPLRRRRALLEERRTALLDRIRLKYPRFATLDARRSISLEDVRRDLLRDSRAVVLEYSLGDSASYLWVLTHQQTRLYRLAARAKIEAEVQRLRPALVDPSPGNDRAFVEAAAALYRSVVQPAEADLSGKRDVYVVPDGALLTIPFEVLLEKEAPAPPSDEAARRAYFAGLSYAFRGARVHYGPSATVLAVLSRGLAVKHGNPPPLDLLAVGEPALEIAPSEDTAPTRHETESAPTGAGGTLGAAASGDAVATRGGLVPLPHAGEEIEAIGGLFPPERRTLLRGEQARERALLEPGFLGRYRVVHFATHGLVDERRPERSSLVLSFPRDATEDGYLQASEIYGLHLNADLVVLSACETGLGQRLRGEGVLGLPRAFLFAGASNVVVSLWSVSDRSTSQFMQEFYRQMTQRHAAPAEAIARARDALRRTPAYAHPFYWASFVLIGPG